MRWQTNIQYVYGTTLSIFFEYTYCIRRDFSIDRKYTVCIRPTLSVFGSYTNCIRPDFSIKRSVYNFLCLKECWCLSVVEDDSEKKVSFRTRFGIYSKERQMLKQVQHDSKGMTAVSALKTKAISDKIASRERQRQGRLSLRIFE